MVEEGVGCVVVRRDLSVVLITFRLPYLFLFQVLTVIGHLPLLSF